jgi:hypothetical protein
VSASGPAPAPAPVSASGPAVAADWKKYTAIDTAAASAKITPMMLTPPLPDRLSISASPPRAATPPAMVSGRGVCPCRAHSQSTMSTMPRYSSMIEMPTGIRAIALK